MPSPRYLTKSRFKLALECPTKLFYTGKKEYVNSKSDDTFLERLAEGGFQVGEMAKLCFPGGHDIETKNNADALQETSELLKQKNAIVYEAAIRYKNCFIRADILVKHGNDFELFEVKAKSYSTQTEFIKERGNIDSSWQPYIADVAFQRYVIRNAFPGSKVTSHLMLVNKDEVARTSGLNQLFKIERTPNDTSARYLGSTNQIADFQNLLIKVNVDREADVFTSTYNDPDFGDFATAIEKFSTAYANDARLDATEPLGTQCAGCEFQASESQLREGLKCGFRECWQLHANFKTRDFARPHIFDIWNFRGKAKLLEQGTYFQDEIHERDIITKQAPAAQVGLGTQERQWLQIQKAVAADAEPYLDKHGLKAQMKGWQYPLHFIDFETSTVAIPFHKGRRPYESVAFQFSHHTMERNGSVAHAGEFLHARPGEFPNFEFVRALKKELEIDDGTVFRYSAHENSILNQIRDQLIDSNEGDRDALCAFIETITEIKFDGKTKTAGGRNMVDLLELVKKYYYQVDMGGSNSLKYVLPATLNASDFLKKKYAGMGLDPYKALPPVFLGLPEHEYAALISDADQRIADGGAALIAYSALQFIEMQPAERQQIEKALLKYCELDTLAMVMLVEAWRDWMKG